MAQTLYLHIGHFKTGTTALQVFMTRNAQRLRRHGLDYAEQPQFLGKHSKLAFSIYRKARITELMHGYRHDIAPEKLWEQFFDDVQHSPAKAVLASTEEFMRIGAHPRAAEILREIIAPMRGRLDIRIIVYLRAPQSHLRSWYNQLVKMNVMPIPDFNAAVCEVMEPIHYDYALALAPWIEIFGPDALIVRPYTDELRSGSALFEDFLSIFGIGLSPRFEIPSEDSNPRMDDRVLELTRVLQVIGATEEEVAWAQTLAAQFNATQMEAAKSSGQDFETVVRRTRSGLAQLTALPGNAVDLQAFAQDLPVAEDAALSELVSLLGYLLTDVRRMRQNLHQRHSDLQARVTELETRLEGLVPPVKS